MIRCVLTDIEGTTSSIEFVHKVLFPYARHHIGEFLLRTQDATAKQYVQKIWTNEFGNLAATEPDLDAVINLLLTWIDRDLKHPLLKALQGMIWKAGYESGAYLGHVYPDVLDAFKAWHLQNIKVAIFSSGSIQAQKLLFAHSEAGNLTSMISEYFDTDTGNKRESQSYTKIGKQLLIPSDEILFLSDIKEELDAAALSGMHTIQLLREPLPCVGEHKTAKTFQDVLKLMDTI